MGQSIKVFENNNNLKSLGKKMQISKIIYYIFIAFIVAIASLLIVSTIPITGNVKILTVLSGSMDPAIKTGSIVIVKPVNDYKIGDIITFGETTNLNAPITHRIHDIKIVEDQPRYITKGDANDVPDQTEVSKSKIVGKVLLTVPYVGYAVDFARKPLGFALIIIIPALIIIFDEVKNIYAEIKKKKTE